MLLLCTHATHNEKGKRDPPAEIDNRCKLLPFCVCVCFFLFTHNQTGPGVICLKDDGAALPATPNGFRWKSFHVDWLTIRSNRCVTNGPGVRVALGAANLETVIKYYALC